MADSDLLSGNVDEEIGQTEVNTSAFELAGEVTTENKDPSGTGSIELYGTDKEQLSETGIEGQDAGNISVENEDEDDEHTQDDDDRTEQETEATDAHADDKDYVRQAMAQPIEIVVTIDEDARPEVKEEVDKGTEEDDDEMETAEAHDSEHEGQNEDQDAEAVEKGGLNTRMYKKEMRAERAKIPFPDSFYKFRYLKVKIGPLKVDDMRTQALHAVMYMATSRFEIIFDKLDVPGRNKYLGYVTIPFKADNPKMLDTMHNKLSHLSMTGRKMINKFPDEIEEALEDGRQYKKKINDIHEKYKEQIFQEKKRSLCARNIPDTVDTDTLKSKFPEAQKIWRNKYGNGLMGVTLVFESRDKAKECQAENTDLTIADKKFTLNLMIRKDNVQRRGRTTHADDELPMEFTGRAARRGTPGGGKGKKAKKRARARAASGGGPAGNIGAPGQGGGRKRKNSAGGRQSGFEAKRPLLGSAPMPYRREENPAAMMAYLKSTLSRMEQKLTQRPLAGGYMDDGYGDSYGGGYSSQSRYQDDSYYGPSYGGVLGAGRQSGYGLGSMGFGSGAADYGGMYGDDSYGGGSGYGGRGGKNRNKRGKRRPNRDAWD